MSIVAPYAHYHQTCTILIISDSVVKAHLLLLCATTDFFLQSRKRSESGSLYNKIDVKLKICYSITYTSIDNSINTCSDLKQFKENSDWFLGSMDSIEFCKHNNTLQCNPEQVCSKFLFRNHFTYYLYNRNVMLCNRRMQPCRYLFKWAVANLEFRIGEKCKLYCERGSKCKTPTRFLKYAILFHLSFHSLKQLIKHV